MNKSRGFVPLVALIYGAVVLLTSLVGYFGYKEYQLKKTNPVFGATTPTPTLVLQTPEPTQTPKPVVIKTIDPDPIINCESSYPNCKGTSIKVRSSQCSKITCCGFNNGIWKIYPSVAECNKDQAAEQSTQQPSQNNTSTYVPPTYYTCTLYYPALHTYTTYNSLYQTKEQCDTAQASLNIGSQTVQIQPAPVDNTANNKQCKATAAQNFAEKKQGVENLYGGTNGIADFTIQNQLTPEYNQAVANCDKSYPL